MADVKYFDSLMFDEEIVEGSDGAITAPDAVYSDASDDSANNDQSRPITYDDWNYSKVKVLSQTGGTDVKAGENFVIYAQLWNAKSGKFLLQSDVESIQASMYARKMRNFASTDWREIDGWQKVSVPNAAMVGTDAVAEWLYDEGEYNFAWSPDQSDAVLFPDEGAYTALLRFELTNNRAPILVAANMIVS